MKTAIWFIPPEFAVLLLSLAGILMIVGARRLAGLTATAAIVSIILPPFIDPILDALPIWILVIMLVVFGLSMARAAMGMVFGQSTTNQIISLLVADAIRFALRAPFTLAFWIIRTVLRIGSGRN